MIRFSTLDLMDEPKCYVYLVAILHPEGLGVSVARRATPGCAREGPST